MHELSPNGRYLEKRGANWRPISDHSLLDSMGAIVAWEDQSKQELPREPCSWPDLRCATSNVDFVVDGVRKSYSQISICYLPLLPMLGLQKSPKLQRQKAVSRLSSSMSKR